MYKYNDKHSFSEFKGEWENNKKKKGTLIYRNKDQYEGE